MGWGKKQTNKQTNKNTLSIFPRANLENNILRVNWCALSKGDALVLVWRESNPNSQFRWGNT